MQVLQFELQYRWLVRPFSTLANLQNRFALVFSEVGNRLEVGPERSGQDFRSADSVACCKFNDETVSWVPDALCDSIVLIRPSVKFTWSIALIAPTIG